MRDFQLPLRPDAALPSDMPVIIEMPKLTDTMTEGNLVRWLKNEGDQVKSGEVLAEVETDKATMEMTAEGTGILGKIYVAGGNKVAIGAPIAVLVAPGETPPDAPAESTAAPAAMSGPAMPKGATTARSGNRAATAVNATGRIKASPLARKVAAERNVDLRGIAGTGPGGRIVRADVLGAQSAAATPKAVQTIRPVAGPDDKRIPLTGMRTIIAERLLASKTQIPHFYLNIEVDAAPLLGLRQEINAASEKNNGNKYTVNDFILKAVAAAAAEVPAVNASFDGDSIVQFAAIHLSVAIAVEDGLVTPVIRSAQGKSLLEISTAVKDLAGRARNKKLTPDEFAGGTITVSNLGAYGIDNFDAIINPPQAAILSIGGSKKSPVVNAAGQIVPGDRMWIGLSCDHRVVDGAVGAQYLAALKKLLENPALMLI